MSRLFAVAALCAILGVPARLSAQPRMERPKVLQIAREIEKQGRGSMHARLEREWAAALSAAGTKTTALALASETGSAEIWWLFPYESFEQMEAVRKQESTAKVAAVMERFVAQDAAHIDRSIMLEAVLVPELSFGAPPDVSTLRGINVLTWQIRPGQEGSFAAGVALYAQVARRAGVELRTATYTVLRGAPMSTYMAFSGYRTLKDEDDSMSDDAKIGAAMRPAEQDSLRRLSQDAIVSMESMRFRVVPDMSLVPDAWQKSDPAFWTPSWRKAVVKSAKKP